MERVMRSREEEPELNAPTRRVKVDQSGESWGYARGFGNGRRKTGKEFSMNIIDCPRTRTTLQRERTDLDIHISCNILYIPL